MNRPRQTGIPSDVEVAKHQSGGSSLLKMQMLVGSVFGFLLVVMIGVASADDETSSNPASPEIELAPAVVVAAGVDSINTNAVARLAAGDLSAAEIGTAFQLDGDRIVTVTHALLDATEISISVGSQQQRFASELVTSSRLHDLSVISGSFTSSVLPVSPDPVALGESVALSGIPESGRIEVITGEVIDRAAGVAFGIGRPDIYVISAGVAPGWSGGPVVNADGEVVAVIVATEENTGVTLAVPIEHLPAS